MTPGVDIIKNSAIACKYPSLDWVVYNDNSLLQKINKGPETLLWGPLKLVRVSGSTIKQKPRLQERRGWVRASLIIFN